MTPEQIAFAAISALMTLVSLSITAFNAWSRVQVRNEILQLRIYVSDNYVTNAALEKVLIRLEKRLDHIDKKLDEGTR